MVSGHSSPLSVLFEVTVWAPGLMLVWEIYATLWSLLWGPREGGLGPQERDVFFVFFETDSVNSAESISRLFLSEILN